MRLSVLVYAFIVSLTITGCRTIQDIRYVQAADASEEGRHEDAFQKYLAVAKADGYSGQASAQYAVADMYLEGKGVSRNPSEALRYFEMVAGSSDRTWRRLALTRLGQIYESGIAGFLEQDRVKAARHYKASVADGDQTASKSLERLSSFPDVYVDQNPGEFQPQGSAVAPAGLAAAIRMFTTGDKESAAQTFLWHARRGNEEAQTLVAKLYKEGTALPQDTRRYAAWAWLAARNGNPRAQFEMGLLNNNSEVFLGTDRESIYWFQLASDQGLAEATNWLGIIAAYPLDKGAKSDWNKAFGYFQKAADAGSIYALVNMGDAYAKGLGVPVDSAKAVDLYRRAATAGSVEARRKLLEVGVELPAVRSASPSQAVSTPTRQQPQVQPRTSSSEAASVAPIRPVQKLGPVEVYSEISPSVFRLIALQSKDAGDLSQGSAVAIASKIAVTNCHVLDGRDAFGAKISGEIALFRLLRRSSKKDVCIVQGDKALRAVKQTRRYADLKVGEKVYAIGSPQSLENTLSEGIISGLRESDGVRYIQTTAPIAQGSSGGGLFDEDGRLIGITTFVIKGGGNLNFAVAIDEALEEFDHVK